jgi:hypothetical protein
VLDVLEVLVGKSSLEHLAQIEHIEHIAQL